jgi:hypothetical protein
MEFEFKASQFEADDVDLRVGFADGENGKHYSSCNVTKSS